MDTKQWVLGIDIGGTKIRSGLVDRKGSLLRMDEWEAEAHLGGKHVAERVVLLAQSYGDAEIAGIGIGTAGQVGLHGEIVSATGVMPGWAGMRLQDEVARRTGKPAAVINDVQAMALGEIYFGEGRRTHHFLCLALGTGVGGAVVCNGSLYRGAHGIAGTLGHIKIHAGGRQCHCGQKGCLEAYVSGTAISERFMELSGKQRSAAEIIESSLNGHVQAAALIDSVIEDLADGMLSLAAVFNPEKIIIAGGVTQSLGNYLPKLRRRVEEQIMHSIVNPFEISISELKDNAMILGAAALMMEK
jgi:glucokinase